ncbi:hypothetical protein Ocin01_08548 [Orchesella cincta]|uniref:Uncharacterized protein n=1 Tax=Orchesella cincta TaxID=48709 RepID=A0A1D2MZQ4_ORCCI|nr:hypothetical protein Ocin01_08548 [Orchesella cincta]
MCGLCHESAKTMQFPTLPNGSSTSSFCKENLHTFERNNEEKLKLVPFMSDRFYCTNNNELKPSRRIQSIQKNIEYLNKLFEVDQLHVQDLSDSLARGKKAIDRRMQDACRDSDYEKL